MSVCWQITNCVELKKKKKNENSLQRSTATQFKKKKKKMLFPDTDKGPKDTGNIQRLNLREMQTRLQDVASFHKTTLPPSLLTDSAHHNDGL